MESSQLFLKEVKRDKKEKDVSSFSLMHQMKRGRKKDRWKKLSLKTKKKPQWRGSMKIKIIREDKKNVEVSETP